MTPRGYDRPLYILPFDHRGSFETKMFGWPPIMPEFVRHRGRVLKEEAAKIEQERTAMGESEFLDEKELQEMAED